MGSHRVFPAFAQIRVSSNQIIKFPGGERALLRFWPIGPVLPPWTSICLVHVVVSPSFYRTIEVVLVLTWRRRLRRGVVELAWRGVVSWEGLWPCDEW